jgi:hypothetical protein
MKLPAPGPEQRLVGGVADQGVLEVVGGLGWAAATEDQLGRDDLVALTLEAAAITGLPYEPDQRDETDVIRVQTS